ncbi:hypothetical protein DFH11DRAFT_708254 [Phellopilus nigrolimitatus]|nr:hypothetical protein DFH11DRAFT_708254 [Phellopilus nigrolimitatus]
MSNGSEGSTSRTGSSSRLATLKSLVPASKRSAMRTFFDRRTSSAEGGSMQSSRGPETGEQGQKQSWREWAGDKISRRTNSMNEAAVEKVSLFPGWAARRYHGEEAGRYSAEFSLEVFVSGFAASYVPPESATRSQRAFMRLAKAYAALPKLPTSDPQTPAEDRPTLRASSSTEELLKRIQLPPTPSEITEESELRALEKQFLRAEQDSETDDFSPTDSDSSSSRHTPSLSTGSSTQVSYVSASPQFSYSPADLARLHTNLNTRLQPFWSRSLPNRTLRLSLYSSAPSSSSFMPDENEADSASDDSTSAPIYVYETTTSAQGSFEAKIRVPWERISQHSGALHIAFGEASEEVELFVRAELLPSAAPMTPNSTMNYSAFPSPKPTACSVLAVPVTHSQVRLISDIDDTIKLSNIVGGARVVFRNVFVRRLEELVIRGMGDWYTSMWSKGVRFHYVSNGPFELLPVINEFIKVSNLPGGSIKMRSYAGRSLFNGLLSAPATRKRDGIVDVLNAFSGARFFLVGDTGEQDLELYAQIAAERHNQILAVFVRDASGADVRVLDDPTGEEIKHQAATFRRTASYAAGMPLPVSPGGMNTPLPAFADTPTQRNFPQTFNDGHGGTHRSHVDTPTQDYLTAGGPSSWSRPRAPEAAPRSSSEPTSASGMGLPSTFFDSGLAHVPSTDSSYPSFPSPSPGNGMDLQFPGSRTKAEVANLPPGERRRYELQERVYRARLHIPSHIRLRVFREPEECFEADRILDELARQRQSGH